MSVGGAVHRRYSGRRNAVPAAAFVSWVVKQGRPWPAQASKIIGPPKILDIYILVIKYSNLQEI
jgi:hypothetical protein